MSEYHVDTALSNFAITEKFNDEDAFVASIVAPSMPVKKKSDIYYKFFSDHLNGDISDLRTPDGFANEITWSYNTANFSTVEHALRKFSTQHELDNADAVVMVDQRDAMHVKKRLLLGYEKRVAALAKATANVVTPAYKWDGATTSILADIVSAKAAMRELIGVDPTHIVMDSLVADKISITTEIKDIVKYLLASGRINEQESIAALSGSGGALPTILQGCKVVTARSFYNTKNPKQTRSITRTWGKDVFLFYIDPSPAVEVATWAKTFMYENLTFYQFTVPGKRGRYVEGYWTIDEAETLSGAVVKISNVLS